MRRFLPYLLVAAGHFALVSRLFEISGSQMRQAVTEPTPESFGGFALFMLTIFLALPGTVLSGLFSQIGLEGAMWESVALGLGSVIWAVAVVGFWNLFLRSPPSPKKRASRSQDFIEGISQGLNAEPQSGHSTLPLASAFRWLRAEAVIIFLATLWAYSQVGGNWWQFGLLFLAPDVALLAYYRGPEAGAKVYNLLHTYVLALPLAVVALGTGGSWLTALGFGWVAHIAIDRALGLGLKSTHSFRQTHFHAFHSVVGKSDLGREEEAATAEADG